MRSVGRTHAPHARVSAHPSNEHLPITAQHSVKPRWHLFPDELPNGKFRGFENREDKSMVRGAFVLGQNMTFRDAGLPTLREGYDPVGTELSNATRVGRAWIFETRNGDVYELKEYNGGLYYYLIGTSTDFALLKSGFTVNKEFGFANIGESSGEFHTHFCNGTDPWNEWNGAFALVLAVTATTIQKTGGGTFQGLPVPFYNSGTRSVVINGVTFTYTGGEGTDTLTGVTPDPTLNGVVAGQIIVQAPRLPNWRVFLPFNVAGGQFTVTETVTGGTSAATGIVIREAQDRTSIVISTLVGSFRAGETITGGTSGATAVLAGTIDNTYGPPLSSVICSHLSRIHCRNDAKKSSWHFSMLDDPYAWTIFPADTSGGRKDIDFGGPITAFGRLNQKLIAYKKRGVIGLSFDPSGTRFDVPKYTMLIQGDDKGTTIGAIGQRSTFSSPYGIVSISQDGKMILLEAISTNDQPLFKIISDPIQPIFNRGNHLDAAGECVDGVLWYAFKSDNVVTFNDTVLTGDLRRKTVDAYGNEIPLRWDVPYIGWQVKDWTAIPDGTGGAQVHWHSSLNSNTYKENEVDKVDNGGGFTANIRTWAESFGAPHIRKRADRAYVELLMRDNSVVNCTMLLDEEGFSQRISKTVKGTQIANRYGTKVYNPNGASVFGSQKIGSNGFVDNRQLFRFYFEIKPTIWFFNISVQFDVDQQNSDFELIRFAVHTVDYEAQTPKALST